MTGQHPSSGHPGGRATFEGHDAHHAGDSTWTDDQLSALVVALRRHIHAASPGTWDFETLHAAKTVTAALSARLAESRDDGPSGGS